MSEKKQDFRTLTRIFIENHADEYELKIYHISLLKVIAEYCDMPLGYCCLGFPKLAKYSGMSEAQRRKVTTHLRKHNLIEQTYIKTKPIHHIGETIIKKNELILTAPIERCASGRSPNLSHDAPIERYVAH